MTSGISKMARLYPTLTYGEGETPASFVSRLAGLHGAGSARRFCGDLGLDFRGIVDGRPQALSDLAGLAGASLGALRRNSIFREASGGFVLRGERLLKSSLRRGRLHVCPECLKSDIATGDLFPEIAARGRVTWLVTPVRTCPIHGMALVEAAASDAHTSHDLRP